MKKFTHSRSFPIPFANTDAAGIVHFSNAATYVESTEHEAMNLLGIEVMGRDGGWPKIHFESDYKAPLKFRDEITVTITLDRVGSSSLTWSWKIDSRGETCWSGKLVTVRVSRYGVKMEIPEEELKLLSHPKTR